MINLTPTRRSTLEKVAAGKCSSNFHWKTYALKGHTAALEWLVSNGYVNQVAYRGDNTGAITGYTYSLTDAGFAALNTPAAPVTPAAAPVTPAAAPVKLDYVALAKKLDARPGNLFLALVIAGDYPEVRTIEALDVLGVSRRIDRLIAAVAERLNTTPDALEWHYAITQGRTLYVSRGGVTVFMTAHKDL